MAQQPNGTHGAGGHGHGSQGGHGSFKSYLIGFLLSIVLTIIPLVAILKDLVEGTAAMVVLLVTAILQFIVQLLFFMHLNDEDKPRYNLMTLIFGLVIVITIVAGSIWIMTNNAVAH